MEWDLEDKSLLNFFARYEFLIEGLILLSLPFYSDSTLQKIKRCYNEESKNQIPVEKIFELGKLESLEPTNIQQVIERLKKMDPGVYFRFLKLSLTDNLFQELTSISLPVLTLSGQHDFFAFITVSDFKNDVFKKLQSYDHT